MPRTGHNFVTACLPLALLAIGACAGSGESLLIVQGQMAGRPSAGYETCDLNLHLAATEDVLATKRIPRAFSTGFTVAPRDEDYFVSISCTEGQGRYFSKAFTFDSEKPQQTVDLGPFVF